tara:strand:- start:7454 stop:7648 length:195 start_codon:yes stop_codon:yes gene_type:complete
MEELYTFQRSYCDDGDFTDSYFKGGVLHRDEGPALLEWAAETSPYRFAYFKHGVAHRDDGPAEI